jgi:hypothetical protein
MALLLHGHYLQMEILSEHYRIAWCHIQWLCLAGHGSAKQRLPASPPTPEVATCSVLFCIFYIRWRPIKASDELVGEL